jgi:hypothetical protein
MYRIFAGKLKRKQIAGTWRRGRQATIKIIPTEICRLPVHDEEFKWLRISLILDFDAARELTFRLVLLYLINLILCKLLRLMLVG